MPVPIGSPALAGSTTVDGSQLIGQRLVRAGPVLLAQISEGLGTGVDLVDRTIPLPWLIGAGVEGSHAHVLGHPYSQLPVIGLVLADSRQSQGIHVVLLTGRYEVCAQAFARERRSSQLPFDKLRHLLVVAREFGGHGLNVSGRSSRIVGRSRGTGRARTSSGCSASRCSASGCSTSGCSSSGRSTTGRSTTGCSTTGCSATGITGRSGTTCGSSTAFAAAPATAGRGTFSPTLLLAAHQLSQLGLEGFKLLAQLLNTLLVACLLGLLELLLGDRDLLLELFDSLLGSLLLLLVHSKSLHESLKHLSHILPLATVHTFRRQLCRVPHWSESVGRALSTLQGIGPGQRADGAEGILAEVAYGVYHS